MPAQLVSSCTSVRCSPDRAGPILWFSFKSGQIGGNTMADGEQQQEPLTERSDPEEPRLEDLEVSEDASAQVKGGAAASNIMKTKND